MERTTLDLWVGIFIAAGIGAILVLALKVGNFSLNGSDTYEVYAYFDNVGGLKPRAPIKSAGVVVGRVEAISFDTKEYKAKVTMKIDRHYKFSKDTTASILTSGLLGEQYIGLDTGADDEMLKNGDTITLTQSAIVLEKLIGQLIFSKASSGNHK
ncbi:MAG TPA: outer membrane lipid asymmetry maintenance protein MlaD [Burkholderiales bacterium]|nr:outer membrane lipid asymmetry maintenance protein MlaD [Burkholderiales bacterium]